MGIRRIIRAIGSGVIESAGYHAARIYTRMEKELEFAWENRQLPRRTFVVLIRVDCPCAQPQCPGYDIFKAPVIARTQEEASWIVGYYVPGWTVLTQEQADAHLAEQEKLEAATLPKSLFPDGTKVTAVRLVGIMPLGLRPRNQGGGDPDGSGGMMN